MDLGLSGKFALVTGGSHGIGLATAKRLASEGCHVAICSRSQQRLDAAMAELKAYGVKLLTVAADLLEAEAADRVMDVVDREWGGVQILVNNVGGGGRWGKEIVDPRTLAPLDEDLIVESVKRTGRCIIADCDWVDSGFSAELSARIHEKCFGKLKAPVKRIGFAQTHAPTVRELENEFYPNARTIVHAVEDMLGLEAANLDGEDFFSHERRFRGPF